MILDKELLTAFIAIFGIVLYALLNSRVSERSLPVISNSEVLDIAQLPLPNLEVVEDTCSICYSEVLYSGSFLTRCDHWYHKECLGRWFEQQEEIRKALSCPNCINPITSNANEEAKSYVEKMKSKPFDAGKFNKFIKYIYIFVNSYHFDYEFLMNELLQIQPGFDINDTLEDGNTLFSLAVKNNNTYAVEYFLKNAIKDINDLSETEQDDLTFAAIKCGHREFALFMIEQSTVLEREFDTIFFESVKNDQVSVVKLLIDKSADINKKEASSGLNAVQLAVFGEKVKTLKLLLSTGKADLNFLDENGMNLFESSIVKGNSGVVRLIIDYESSDSVLEFVNKFDDEGRGPLLLACIYRKTNVIKVLIEAGAEIDLKCPYGFSPIEYVINNVDDDELFEVFLNEIKNDRQKLESAKEYADRSSQIRYSAYYKKIETALSDLRFREKKLDEVIHMSRNEYQESDIVKHLIDKYAKPIHDISRLSVRNELSELIISLFEGEKYDLIIDLILKDYDPHRSISLNATFWRIDHELWFKFFEKILGSDRKDELINEVANKESSKIATILYYTYLTKNELPYDNSNLRHETKHWVAGYISEILIRNFDADLYQKFLVFFENMKQNLPELEENGENIRIRSILLRTETLIKMARFSIDESVLSELEPEDIVTLLIYKIHYESREDIARNFLATMDFEQLNGFLSRIMILGPLVSKKLYKSLFRFFQMIPEEAQPIVYNSVHFGNLALNFFKISDFSIETDLTYTFTFQPRAEHLTWGITEPIVHRPGNIETVEFFCKILNNAVFDSSEVFNRSFQTLLNYMGQDRFFEQMKNKPINHENIQFLIESDELIDLLQRMDIKLKFSAKFIETISIENISERYGEKPIFLVPEDLEFVPNNDIGHWNKIEVLTGKSIYQMLIENLIPRIENEDPSIYVDIRNIFVHLASGQFVESLKKIKAKNLKKMLAIDFPELEMLIEN